MQVRFLGFRIASNCKILTLDDYINFMVNNSGMSHKIGEHKRFVYYNNSHSSYYIGLFVTVKDQKTFCELVDKSGNFIVQVNKLNGNSNLIDFNFFVINKTNGFGMYQHYYQSCCLNSFGDFNKRQFEEFKISQIETEISKLELDGVTDKEKVTITKKYKGDLKLEILVRQEQLKELIEEFEKVKAFEYSFVTPTIEESEFQPLTNFVTKKSTKLSFDNKSPVGFLASVIAKISKKGDIKNGKVTGIDENGITRILKITDNPDNFGEYNYDDVAGNIHSLDINKFEKSWVVSELLKQCATHKHIFEA